MSKLPDPQLLAKRTIEILGGLEDAREKIDREFLEKKIRWEQDVTSIGRILRAHLYIEYYLTEYVNKANPRLGDLNKMRISFAQKIDLLDPNDPQIKSVIPGIRHLNKVRNRLAHNLEVEVTVEDTKKFLSATGFKPLRDELAKPDTPNEYPLQILEDFSKYAAVILNHQFSNLGSAFSQALEESANEIT
jgi:hypothetical protein